MSDYMSYWQVDAYEAKNQELVAENADLRALLRSMQVCVTSLANLLFYLLNLLVHCSLCVL